MSESLEVEIDGDRIRVRAPVGRVLTVQDVDTIRKIRNVLRETGTTVRDWSGNIVATTEDCAHEAWEQSPTGYRSCADCGIGLPGPEPDPVVDIDGPTVIRASDMCPMAHEHDPIEDRPAGHRFRPKRGNGAAPTWVETCECGATWRDGRIIPAPTNPEGTNQP